MNLWLTKTILTLIIPFSMVYLGYSYLVNPPKNINSSSGYRTSMSMKNKKTWEFAHRYIGTVWLKSGLLMLFLAALTLYIIAEKPVGTFEYVCKTIQALELTYFFITIICTEIYLRKRFIHRKKRVFQKHLP